RRGIGVLRRGVILALMAGGAAGGEEILSPGGDEFGLEDESRVRFLLGVFRGLVRLFAGERQGLADWKFGPVGADEPHVQRIVAASLEVFDAKLVRAGGELHLSRRD